MRIIQNPVKITPVAPLNPSKIEATNPINSFEQVLIDKISSNGQIKFSKHASMRLNSRNICFTNEQLKKLEKGIKKAEEKGIKDSLVLMDKVALVVNIKKRTVVTAMDSSQTNETVFTNIDGAVIV
ncbi:MAG: flagellar biosynthesis protein [Epulopiscium sp.]|nr:flagellar biosynthesis protein [Candidatus Epulonipiscium sp.]